MARLSCCGEAADGDDLLPLRLLTYVEGEPLSDPGALELPGLDRKALAENITRGFLAQALDHGLFHADLHEGNLFVAAPARVIAVDYGIVGRLGPGERKYLADRKSVV